MHFALGRRGTTEVWYNLERLNTYEVVPAIVCMVITSSIISSYYTVTTADMVIVYHSD